MNDIEVLEDFKNNKIQRDKLEIDQRCGGWKMGHIYKSLELNPAIENLLKERQSDKERIKLLELEKQAFENTKNSCPMMNTSGIWCDSKERIKELEENNQQLEKWSNYYKLGNTVEEFEKLFGNTPINDIEEIKKYIFQNFIPKSLIKEKIEEYQNNMKKYEKETHNIFNENNIRQEVITVLEELLKGE